jgi:alkylation response protein AidB-like acyl-CoA dehydrogenase
VEWSKAELEGWLIQQAYEGMLRAVEEDREARRHVAQGKMAIAELAESALRRICRVIGGGTFSRSSPFGYWYEDVRALGFLRPPWGLAYDRLFEGSWLGSE